MTKEHKLALDYQAGPAIFYRCVRCKGKAFYLTNLWKFGQNIKHAGLMDKFKTTYKMVERFNLLVKPYLRSSYKISDYENLLRYTCDEMIIKDVVE